MDEKIEQLVNRYGRRNYEVLTSEQREFLLAPEIKDNTSCSGGKTVQIKSFGRHEDATLLSIVDTFYYTFHKNSISVASYGSTRIPEFKKVLGIAKDPMKVKGIETYLFNLGDGSKIQVQYDTLKDTT